MKCDVCLKLLEEYVDSELAGHEAGLVRAHLITCAGCASEFDGLTAEKETYARYDRALEISPSMWRRIAECTAPVNAIVSQGSQNGLRDRIAGMLAAPTFRPWFAGAAAVLLIAVLIGATYMQMHLQRVKTDVALKDSSQAGQARDGQVGKRPVLESVATAGPGADDRKSKRPMKALPHSRRNMAANLGAAGQPDVLFSDVVYSVVEEQETQRHLEQAQNLLRSIRNIQFSEDDTEIDVSYEKALSRRLLNENVVLRREAEMNGKFPVKMLLASLEPFLLDIANLPDKTSPEDLSVIKDRVQKTEIVAALHSY